MQQYCNEKRYSIFVDGAAPNNQHGCMRGGIGVAIYDELDCFVHGESITIDRLTDNAELELMALIEGLEFAQDGDTVYSDSEFCVRGYNEWLEGWKSRGWRKSNNKSVSYRHLWQAVDVLRSRKYIQVVKVKAHAGIEGNEMADQLAVKGAIG